MPDKKTLIKWSQGCLLCAIICVIIGLLFQQYLFYAGAAVLVILSFVIFGFARKKEEQ